MEVLQAWAVLLDEAEGRASGLHTFVIHVRRMKRVHGTAAKQIKSSLPRGEVTGPRKLKKSGVFGKQRKIWGNIFGMWVPLGSKWTQTGAIMQSISLITF